MAARATGRAWMAGVVLAVWGLAGCGRAPLAEPAAEGAGGIQPLALQSETFEAEVLNSPVPVVVDFWAPWCGPCRRVAPAMETLSREFDGRIKVCKLNVDEAPDIAGKYDIRAIPALLAFKSGEVVDERVGALREREYRAWFQSLL